MAKKDKDTIFEAFLADLKAINPAVEEVLKDDKVSAKLKESVLARADYSQSMDALRSERESFAAEVAEAREKIQGWQKWYGDTSREVAAVQGRLREYVEAYGELETAGDKRKAATALGITKDELNEALESRMNQRDLAALKFADDLTDVKIDFRDRFKEALDTEALFKLAGERQIDLKTAYKEFINPRVEELRTKDVEARIAQAKKEAVEEFASQHKLPVVDTRSDVRPHSLDVKDAPKTPHDRVAAAIASLRS